MEWIAFKNSDEMMQGFVALIGVGFILLLMGANLYWWLKEKFKKRKNGNI